MERGRENECTLISTFQINALSIQGCGQELVEKSFWDAVGDEIMTAFIGTMWSGRYDICCLIPGQGSTEGLYYSEGIVNRLLELERKCGERQYFLLETEQSDDTARNREEIIRKKVISYMYERSGIPSLKDYRASLDRDKETESVPKSIVSGDSGSHQIQESSVWAVSPFRSGTGAAVSSEARKKALNFAHPVDGSIIKLLDNPAINAVFHKVVQAGIDANYGLALATGIHVSRNTYREIYDVIVECADTLGIPVPYVIVSDSVKGINACTAGTEQFAFIAISSMLPLVLNRGELKFVIGHECGHLVLGHVVYHTAMSMISAAGGFIPLVGPAIAKTVSLPLNAWSRRSEISADRAGLICCGDLQTAKRALIKLEAGLLNVSDVDIDAYIRDSEEVMSNLAIGELAEAAMQHPIIPKRMKALNLFAESAVYAENSGTVTLDKALLSAEELKKATEEILEIL